MTYTGPLSPTCPSFPLLAHLVYLYPLPLHQHFRSRGPLTSGSTLSFLLPCSLPPGNPEPDEAPISFLTFQVTPRDTIQG